VDYGTQLKYQFAMLSSDLCGRALEINTIGLDGSLGTVGHIVDETADPIVLLDGAPVREITMAYDLEDIGLGN
jgi:hypothetical protein